MKTANERLMIVRLKLKQWHPRKFDRKASDELAALHGAAAADDIGRFNKILIDMKSIKPLQKAIRELRDHHYQMTAPWSDDGQRVLPAELYFDYCEMLRVRSADIEALADQFVDVEYADQRTKAAARLNGLFNADDYPDPDTLREKFSVAYRFEPLPNPEDTRVWGISDEAANEIADDLKASMTLATDAAHADVVERVYTRATEFVQKVRRFHQGELDDKARNSLYETAVTNLQDIVELVLKGLNVNGDQELTKMAASLAADIEGLNTTDLKQDSALRIEKTAEIEDRLSQFSGVFGGMA